MTEEADALIAAIDGTNGKRGAVIHTSNGSAHKDSGGISTFCPYSTDPDRVIKFQFFNEDKAAPYNQKLLYAQKLSLLTTGAQTSVQNTSAPVSIGEKGSSRFNVLALQDLPLTIGKDKHVTAKLTPEQLESVSKVGCLIIMGVEFSSSEVGIGDEGAIILGNNIAVKTDWNSGTFRDDFRPQWLKLDGHLLAVEMTFHGNGYKLFEAPIKLNGQPCSLQISYTEADNKYHLNGARKYSENGIASRGGLDIQAGDEITPLFMAFVPPESLDADEGAIINKFYDANDKLVFVIKRTEGKAFTIGQNPTLEEKPLDDYNYFGYCFEFFAPDGMAASSQFAMFTVENGKVTKSELVPVKKADITAK